jgi:hypothetical protein
MRAMKDGPHTIERNADSRARAFRYLGTERFQYRLNIAPRNVRPDWVFKNNLERSAMLLVHPALNDIIR